MPGATTSNPHLIAVDWGTTSFRAYLTRHDGTVIEQAQLAKGIMSVDGGRFADALGAGVATWLSRHGALPILMSGMIGSRQGWHEAAYVACPAEAAAIARGLLRFEVAEGAARGAQAAIVPGVTVRSASGLPDVMRGEETQIIGVMQRLGVTDATFILPGTHSKWVTVQGGVIVGFATYMTGEVFAALKDHTILGRLMAAPAAPGMTPGFARGIDGIAGSARAGRGPGALLQLVFSTRTLGLFSELEPGDASDYLSGLLIGAEIVEASADARQVIIVGSDALAERYQAGCRRLGMDARTAPADSAAAGLATIARAAGLIGDR